MSLRYNGQLVENVRNNDASLQNLYYNGDKVWQSGGLPKITAFSVTPDKLLNSAPPQNITLAFAVTGSDRNVITETLADGTIRNIPLSGLNTVIPAPTLTARYALDCRNINGVSHREVVFHRGTLPVITQWRWGSFRQGATLTQPDSVLLEWVVQAVPDATLDISPDIFFHPNTPTGSYRYSRVGRRTNEVLTLTATNIFGSASSQLTIAWP